MSFSKVLSGSSRAVRRAVLLATLLNVVALFLTAMPASQAQTNAGGNPVYTDGDYTGTIFWYPPLDVPGLGVLRDDLEFTLADCVVTVAQPAVVTLSIVNCGYGGDFEGPYGAIPFEFPNGETCGFHIAGFTKPTSAGLSAQGTARATCPSGVWRGSGNGDNVWTATAEAQPIYDGTYGGGYSGQWGSLVPPGQSKNVTGGVAFSVSGGSFTMTKPWAVTGTVSPGGNLFFRTTSYSVIFPGGFLCTLTISGLITTAADGAGAGSWEGNCGSSGHQRGSWHASRGDSPDPDPTATPSDAPPTTTTSTSTTVSTTRPTTTRTTTSTTRPTTTSATTTGTTSSREVESDVVTLYRRRGSTFIGFVDAEESRCVARRVVYLYRLLRGSPSMVDHDFTDRDGEWQISVRRARGRYFAEVATKVFTSNGQRVTCLAAESETIGVK